MSPCHSSEVFMSIGLESSVFLISAKMGVTEIVEEILHVYPEAINDLDEDRKNALLLAAEHKQPAVYNMLLKKLGHAFLFERVDKYGNGALHLAADLGKSQSWHASGIALQMQSELKWYQFIKEQSLRWGFNSEGKTPNEIFIEKHKEMAQKAQEWLTSTSNACSVVATVIASVGYASVTELQGAEKNRGQATAQSLRPHFTCLHLLISCLSSHVPLYPNL